MEKKFQRPISLTERLWLGVDMAYPPYANQVVLEGSGRLDHKDLIKAVESASEANPGSRLVLKGALRKCYWIDSGKCPGIKIVKNGQWDGYSSDNAPFLTGQLPYTGPTCQVIYVEGSVPRLVFRSNHGVMDGMGTFTWMEDIFKVLRGEEPIGSRSTLNEELLVMSLSKRSQKMHPIESIGPTGKAGKFENGVTWKRLTFYGAHSKLMGKVGNAIARSAWKYGEGVVRLGIPVDIRARQDGLRATGNLSMAIYLEITKNSTPESITEDIRTQLENKNDLVCIEGGNYIDMIPLWLTRISVKLITRALLKRGKYSQSAMLSNLGRIDKEKFCGGGFVTDTVFLIPPRFETIPAFVVLTGSGKRLEITVSVPNALAGDGRLNRLLDDISEALK